MTSFSFYFRTVSLTAITILALGCREADRIQSYTVPKEPPRLAGESAATGGSEVATSTKTANTAPTDRMLAAILPEGQRAWFFKVVGPIDTINKHADKITEFLASVRPAGDEPLPEWKLPAGWTLGPERPMRAATIIIPGDKPLELTVSTLGWPGTTDAMLANINRWRGQMKLPLIEKNELSETTTEQKAGDATMTVVDLKGRFESTMTPPFAGRPPFAPEVGAASRAVQDGASNLPTNHPPINPSTPAPTAPPAGATTNDLRFEAPKSWQQLPAEGMRKAAFSVADGDKQALVMVIEFSADAGPMITDPLENVNRWRGEIGLAHVDKDSLGKVTEPIKIDGRDATYVPAVPDTSKPEESQVARATLAAMVRDGDRIWFIKLNGDRDLVAREQQNFTDFLKSIRFGGDRGATDGK